MLPPRDGAVCASLGDGEVKEGRGLGGFGFRVYCLGRFAVGLIKGVRGFGFRGLRAPDLYSGFCVFWAVGI